MTDRMRSIYKGKRDIPGDPYPRLNASPNKILSTLAYDWTYDGCTWLYKCGLQNAANAAVTVKLAPAGLDGILRADGTDFVTAFMTKMTPIITHEIFPGTNFYNAMSPLNLRQILAGSMGSNPIGMKVNGQIPRNGQFVIPASAAADPIEVTLAFRMPISLVQLGQDWNITRQGGKVLRKGQLKYQAGVDTRIEGGDPFAFTPFGGSSASINVTSPAVSWIFDGEYDPLFNGSTVGQYPEFRSEPGKNSNQPELASEVYLWLGGSEPDGTQVDPNSGLTVSVPNQLMTSLANANDGDLVDQICQLTQTGEGDTWQDACAGGNISTTFGMQKGAAYADFLNDAGVPNVKYTVAQTLDFLSLVMQNPNAAMMANAGVVRGKPYAILPSKSEREAQVGSAGITSSAVNPKPMARVPPGTVVAK